MGFDTMCGFGHTVCEGPLGTKGKCTIGYIIRAETWLDSRSSVRMRREHRLHWHSRAAGREGARENREPG